MSANSPSPSTNAPFFADLETITLSKDGIWLSDGIEITHGPTRRLFSKSLSRDSSGVYLKIGRESKKIVVEDTCYFVTRIEGSPASGYQLFCNDETSEHLLPDTLKYSPGRLTCKIKGGAEEAKFLRNPYFDLLQHLEEDQDGYFLKLENQPIRLAKR